MRDSVDFSIIIPTYNCGHCIGDAINSVLKQTYTQYEIIVQDGQSRDNTAEVVSRFRDPRISFYCEKDTGIYDAMNRGIKRSTGQWLIFLGSDDELFDCKVLERIVHARSQCPKTKFIYGDVFTSEERMQRYENYTYLKLLEKCICHQSIFYHRSLFDDSRYNEEFKICADWDFNLKVFRRYNYPVYVGSPLAKFCLGGASNNWKSHPEYIQHFSNVKASIIRYRGYFYLIYYFWARLMSSVFRNGRRVKQMFARLV